MQFPGTSRIGSRTVGVVRRVLIGLAALVIVGVGCGETSTSMEFGRWLPLRDLPAYLAVNYSPAEGIATLAIGTQSGDCSPGLQPSGDYEIPIPLPAGPSGIQIISINVRGGNGEDISMPLGEYVSADGSAFGSLDGSGREERVDAAFRPLMLHPAFLDRLAYMDRVGWYFGWGRMGSSENPVSVPMISGVITSYGPLPTLALISGIQAGPTGSIWESSIGYRYLTPFYMPLSSFDALLAIPEIVHVSAIRPSCTLGNQGSFSIVLQAAARVPNSAALAFLTVEESMSVPWTGNSTLSYHVRSNSGQGATSEFDNVPPGMRRPDPLHPVEAPFTIFSRPNSEWSQWYPGEEVWMVDLAMTLSDWTPAQGGWLGLCGEGAYDPARPTSYWSCPNSVETRSMDGVVPKWKGISGSGLPPLTATSVVFDGPRHRLIAVGGYEPDPNWCPSCWSQTGGLRGYRGIWALRVDSDEGGWKYIGELPGNQPNGDAFMDPDGHLVYFDRSDGILWRSE